MDINARVFCTRISLRVVVVAAAATVVVEEEDVDDNAETKDAVLVGNE